MMSSLLYISRLEKQLRSQQLSGAITESVDNQRRKSQTATKILAALKEREDSISAAKAKAKEDLNLFVTRHRRTSLSKGTYGSVVEALRAKAEQEERQRADARKKLTDIMGSRSKTTEARKSFYSVMTELQINTPLTPAEKSYLERPTSPDPASSPLFHGGDDFVSLATGDIPFGSLSKDSIGEDLAAAGGGSDSAIRRTSSRSGSPLRSASGSPEGAPPLSPPKPVKPKTPVQIEAEAAALTAEQIKQLEEKAYLDNVAEADKDQQGIFATERSLELPAQWALPTITNPGS